MDCSIERTIVKMYHKARYIFFLIRPVNLLMVIASQLLVYYIVIVPFLISQNVSPVLANGKIYWFIIATLCITASGFVINDIFDINIDKHNKPDRMVISKHLTIRQGWLLYGMIIGVGLIVAFGIALNINRVWLTLLYPLAIILLFYYSKQWKHQSITGNLIVSLFCMFVPGILWYAEYQSILLASILHPRMGNTVQLALVFYCLFAFISTLIREIIKDLEDMEGDQLEGSKHFVIKTGIKNAKRTVFVLTGVLLSGIVIFITFWSQTVSEYIPIIGGIVFLVLPSCFIIHQLLNAENSSHYGRASYWAKIWMAGGLVYLLLIHLINW